MNKLVSHIQATLKEVLEELFKTEISPNDLSLEMPPKKELGDYAFPCFWLSKLLKKWPAQIWQEIIDFVNKNQDKYNIFSSLEVAGPYLNIKINKDFISKFFAENNSDILSYYQKENEDKTIIIDYIWANVWKPLHIGHMCTPNQWQVLINLYRKFWYNVISDSHIWDWGIIFWKLILAYKMWWDENKLKENAVEHLFELYVKITSETDNDITIEQQIRDEFKLLSEWNTESIILWQKFTRYSIDFMQVQLSRLFIKPDYNIWESFYEWLNLPRPNNEDYPDLTYDMKQIVEELVKNKIATKNEDGSVWVVFPEETKIPSCILQKRDWTHWYLASDLACIKYRMQNWNPEKILYFVDVRQQLHLKQVFTISKIAWWISAPLNKGELKGDSVSIELFHAYNWFISLKDGAMSTRKWRIIKLEALLDEAEDRAKKIIQEKRDDIKWSELDELAKKVWIWAIKYWYLSKSRTTDVIFDWDEFMTFEWNSWPYIQYAYVRAMQILEKSWIIPGTLSSASFDHDEEIDLVKELFNYKDVLQETASTCFPHLLCNYAYNLTKKFNSFYNKVHILSEENESKKLLKLQLVLTFSEVLKDAFDTIWIQMPEKM